MGQRLFLLAPVSPFPLERSAERHSKPHTVQQQQKGCDEEQPPDPNPAAHQSADKGPEHVAQTYGAVAVSVSRALFSGGNIVAHERIERWKQAADKQTEQKAAQ